MRIVASQPVAGARVDRIADAAGSNKAQIYHYFDSKDAPFDAVFRQLVLDTIDAVPLDPRDLPDYAGRLFDAYERNPDLRRIATWRRLERGAPTPTSSRYSKTTAATSPQSHKRKRTDTSQIDSPQSSS